MNNTPDYIVGYDRVLTKVDSPCLAGWEEAKDIEQLKAAANSRTPKDIEVGVKWVGGKISNEVMKKVLGTIHAYPHRETAYVLYYNPQTRQFVVKCPEQGGFGAAVNFKDDGVPPEPGFATIGSIHTHPEMGAFWSSTDMADQANRRGLHIVFGLRDGHVAFHLCSVFTLAGRYDQKLEDVMDPIDFAKDYPAVSEWRKIIDKGDFDKVFTKEEKEMRSRDLRRRGNIR